MIKKILYILIICLTGTNLVYAESMTFTSYPSHTKNQNKWIVRDVNPGQSYREYFTVENLTDLPIDLDIKTIETSGSKENIRILEDRPAQNIGKWIKIKENHVSLQRNEKKEIPVDITVPGKTALGEYQAAIMVSHISKNPGQMNLSTRIGNRIYLNVTDNPNLQTNTFSLQIADWQILLIGLSLAGLVYGLKPQKTIKQTIRHDS